MAGLFDFDNILLHSRRSRYLENKLEQLMEEDDLIEFTRLEFYINRAMVIYSRIKGFEVALRLYNKVYESITEARNWKSLNR